mgnify:CR=1 FL=1
MTTDEIIDLVKKTIKNEADAVTSLLPQINSDIVTAAEMMLACQGHVLVAGAGTSHAVGARFAHLLSCCGTPALFIHPGDSQHGLAGAVSPRDVLFAISKGGETTEVNYLASIAKKRGAKIIALTEKPASTLGQLSDQVLVVKSPPEADPFGMIATGTSLVYCAYLDAICVLLLKLRGYTRDQFGETHPGGAVGLKLISS